ncbi:MAG TPA: helix-turn-helix domain-containing protein [Candidatus Limnocylindrales bacterium]|nr:helix-turn-helix domain-containing protein [Candidatus Limnocylindrales bacterium]
MDRTPWTNVFDPDMRSQVAAYLATMTDSLADAVAADSGATRADVMPAVAMALELLGDPVGPDKGLELFRQQGAAGARAGIPRAELLDRFLTAGWVMWDAVCASGQFDAPTLASFGSWLLRGLDLVASAVAEGYIEADRELMARRTEARRAFLEEVLTSIAPDPAEAAHLRRAALRYGLDVDAPYRLILVSAGDDEDEQGRVDRIGGLIDIAPAAARSRAGISLPEVLVWHRWIVVLAPADWPASARLRPALEHVLGNEWTALVGPPEPGVGSLAPMLARLTATLRAAERLGHRGWIDSPDDFAIEELMLVDPELLGAVVGHELGPLLADHRMGDELIETLRVYLESGQNMRETARRMHLANRTIAYRRERIEHLLGRPLEGATITRLGVALLAYRIGRPDAPTG